MLNILIFSFCLVLHQYFYHVESCERSGMSFCAVVGLRRGTLDSYLGTQMFVCEKKLAVPWSLLVCLLE